MPISDSQKVDYLWKKIGYSTIREYDSSQNYSEYVCKYMNLTDNRNWDFISNLQFG